MTAVLELGSPVEHTAAMAGRSPQTVRKWVEDARRGRDGRGRPAPGADVARRLGLAYPDRSGTTAHGQPTAAQMAAQAPAPDGDAEPLGPDDADLLALLRGVLSTQTRGMQEASRIGNHAAAQKYGRDAAGLGAVIARLEKAAKSDDDVIRVARHEIDARLALMRERVEALQSRPLLCAHCSRALSVAWGRGTDLATE